MSGTPELQHGERRITQIDPETGLITESVRTNWTLLPIYGLVELVGDIVHGRMRTRDWVWLFIVVHVVLRAH